MNKFTAYGFIACAATVFAISQVAAAAGVDTEAMRQLRDRRVMVDSDGHVVRDAAGNKRNTPLVAKKPQAAVAPVAKALARTDQNIAQAIVAADHAPRSSFTPFGSCLGCAGLELYRNNGRTEILSSTTGVQIPSSSYLQESNDFWYALVADGSPRHLEQRFVSERMPGGIASLLLLPGKTRSNDQIAICGFDGSVRFYSAATKTLLPAESRQFPLQDVTRCVIGDFDHSGKNQYLFVSRSQPISIFNDSGDLVWSLPWPLIAYQDVQVGQMDSDPALEIAVSQYFVPWLPPEDLVTVYDGASHSAQLHLDATALTSSNQLAIAQTGTNSYTLMVADSGSIVAFDTISGARRWQTQVNFDIRSLKVARLYGGSAQQLLVGDGQWGSVHVIDIARGTPEFDISNPEWGVVRMAVGDVDGDGAIDILWGADAGNSGPQRFAVADVATRQVKMTSADLDTYFSNVAFAHLFGDHTKQIVFASQTTDNGYDPGSLVVLDAGTGHVRAVQDVPLFQGWGTDTAVQVADVDGDGIDDIVVASTHLYDGAVDVYGLTPDAKIVQKQTTWGGYGLPNAYPAFSALAMVDSDRRAKTYAAVGFSQWNTSGGILEALVVGLDLNTGAEKWRLALPYPSGSFFGTPPPAEIQKVGRDRSGAELFMVRRSQPGVYPPTGWIDILRVRNGVASVVASYQGSISATHAFQSQSGQLYVAVGTYEGQINVLALRGSNLLPVASRAVSAASIDALRVQADGSTWVVTAHRLEKIRRDGSVAWQSQDRGYYTPASLKVDQSNSDATKVWVSSVWRVESFDASGGNDQAFSFTTRATEGTPAASNTNNR